MPKIARERFLQGVAHFIVGHIYIIVGVVIFISVVSISVMTYIRSHVSYCVNATEIIEGFDSDLFINENNGIYQEITLYITKGSKRARISMDGSKWLRLYFNEQPVVQVKYLSRVFTDPCTLARGIRYTFGVPIEAVHVEHDGMFVYSTDIKRWFDIKFNAFVHNLESVDLPKGKTYTLEDKTSIVALGFDEFFTVIKKYTFIDEIQQEGIFVEVFNSTRKVGYATYWGRTLKSLGFIVSRSGNYPELPDYAREYDMYLYYTPEVDESYTLRILRRLIQGYRVFESTQRPPYLLTTGDIVLILLR